MARAAPLSPDARRASIIAATLPLLRLHGRAVTTSQIAMAAGVAEGTLFRVFPDKDALIEAAVATAFDSAPTEAELSRIDRTQPLRDILIEAVEILRRRVVQVWELVAVLRLPLPPPERQHKPPPGDAEIHALLVALFEAHRDEIRCEPEQAARFMRSIAMACSHPRLIETPLTSHEIVTLLLDGIRARDEED